MYVCGLSVNYEVINMISVFAFEPLIFRFRWQVLIDSVMLVLIFAFIHVNVLPFSPSSIISKLLIFVYNLEKLLAIW